MMLTDEIQLWEDGEGAKLQLYVQKNSTEFQSGKRRPAIIVCPGGAYLCTSDREAEPVALRYASRGYHVFVLRYTTHYKEINFDLFTDPPQGNPKSAYPQPLLDLAKAVLTVRERADDWLVETDQVTVCGFSAGGHLAASLGVHWQDDYLSTQLNVSSSLLKPNALILGYPVFDYTLMKAKIEANPSKETTAFWNLANQAVFGKANPSDAELIERSPITHVSSLTPPCFIWHTAGDSLVYAENSLRFAMRLAEKNVPYELHIFADGDHGLSLADETTARGSKDIIPQTAVWFDLAINWLKNIHKGKG